MLYRQRALDTPHGTLQTPVLFPVSNIGTRSSDNTPEYTNSIPDLSTAMVNARAIRNRSPQWSRLLGDCTLRDEMEVSDETIIFADSGGFHFDEEEVDTTPEETLETQNQIEADIFGTVDIPLSQDNRKAENHRRITQSIDFALEASDRHNGEQLLFASVHGFDPETIRNTIQHLEKSGEFDGYAIGSLVPIRTQYERVTKIILAARRATEKHIHVYGLGGVTYQPLLLYLGVDSFDSSAFIRSAGNRNYLIPGFGGEPMKNIDGLSHLPCACPICSKRSFQEVRDDRDLLVQHNLWALALELRRFRYIAAADNDLEEYLELRFRDNPVTRRAFRLAKQQVRRLK